MSTGKWKRNFMEETVPANVKEEWEHLIDSLKGDEVLLLWAHYCEDWKLEELGKEFNITKEAMRQRINKALAHLKIRIMKDCPNIKSKLMGR